LALVIARRAKAEQGERQMTDAPLYLYLSIAVTLFVLWDTARRGIARVRWAIGSALAWPVVLPAWMCMRPLRTGEVRRGGRAWNLLRYFALAWTLLWGAHLAVTVGVGAVVAGTSESKSDRDAGLSMVVLLGGMYLVIWLVPALGALLLGALLRRSDQIERGPDPTSPVTT
jgi:hypothetical protein